MKKTFQFLEGEVLLINKPLHLDELSAGKQIALAYKKEAWHKKIKVGHAGTLDPLASGLMIICTSKKPKKLVSIRLLKEYIATLKLGATTPSYDGETEETCAPHKTYFKELIISVL